MQMFNNERWSTVTIYSHTIGYRWLEGDKDRELNDSDVEHIQDLLKEDYIEGQLCSFDYKTEEEVFGWWKILN